MQTIFRNFAYFANQPAQKTGQKFLFLFGAPGVGKGTYAKMLRKDMHFNHISTGDEIRKILKGTVASGFDPKLIETIRSIVKSGGLVSD
jgi:adenylate kinase